MRHGVCPKCGATAVRAARHGVVLGGDRPDSLLRPHIDQGFRGAIRTHAVRDLWWYACTSCGYLESYLLDEEALEYVRQHWIEVPPQQ